MREVETIFNEVLKVYDKKRGLYAIYIFDMSNKKSSYKIVDKEAYDINKVYEIFKNISELVKKSDFEMLLVEFNERYFIKRILKELVIFVVGDKTEPLGRVFATINTIKIS